MQQFPLFDCFVQLFSSKQNDFFLFFTHSTNEMPTPTHITSVSVSYSHSLSFSIVSVFILIIISFQLCSTCDYCDFLFIFSYFVFFMFNFVVCRHHNRIDLTSQYGFVSFYFFLFIFIPFDFVSFLVRVLIFSLMIEFCVSKMSWESPTANIHVTVVSNRELAEIVYAWYER